MKLSTVVYQFFGNYLPHIKGASNATIKTYRDAFTLFLPFAANYCSVKIKSLTLDHLSSELILAFLHDIEQQRKNTARTRNHRLAVIKSLAKMIRFMYPDQRQMAENILRIPQKRMQKKLIGFLYPDEITNVLNAVDLKKSQGLRDYCILQLLYDSGLRASELATLNLDYFDPPKKNWPYWAKAIATDKLNCYPSPANCLRSILVNIASTQNRCTNSACLSAENISQWHCLKSASSSSMPSIASDTPAPSGCLRAETPSPTSEINWVTIMLNLPWCISSWTWQEKNISSSNLSNTPSHFYSMIQISINSSIGKTKKILWTGSMASKPRGPRFVAKNSYK
jgi:hypothetical protein